LIRRRDRWSILKNINHLNPKELEDWEVAGKSSKMLIKIVLFPNNFFARSTITLGLLNV
jgi:hypothetical protein